MGGGTRHPVCALSQVCKGIIRRFKDGKEGLQGLLIKDNVWKLGGVILHERSCGYVSEDSDAPHTMDILPMKVCAAFAAAPEKRAWKSRG